MSAKLDNAKINGPRQKIDCGVCGLHPQLCQKSIDDGKSARTTLQPANNNPLLLCMAPISHNIPKTDRISREYLVLIGRSTCERYPTCLIRILNAPLARYYLWYPTKHLLHRWDGIISKVKSHVAYAPLAQCGFCSSPVAQLLISVFVLLLSNVVV